MNHSPAVWRSNAEKQPIEAGRSDVDGIIQPFAGARESDVVTAAGIGTGFDVHTFRAILAALIHRIGIGIGQFLSALIEVFRLDQAREGRRDTAERSGRDANAGALKFDPVQNKKILVTGISREHKEECMRPARIENWNANIGISASSIRNVRGSEQCSGRRIQSRLDSAAETGGSDAIGDAIDVRQIYGEQADKTSVIDVGDIEPSIHITGEASGDATVSSAKLCLFMSGLKSERRGPDKRRDTRRAVVRVRGVQDKEKVVGIGMP